MNKKKIVIIAVLLLTASLFIVMLTNHRPITAQIISFAGPKLGLGCGMRDCMECHSLSNRDVSGMLQKLNAGHVKVMNIQMSPVKGLWEVSVDDKGQKGVVYVDFSKKYIVSGPIIAVDQRIDVTRQRTDELQRDRRIDVSKIPLHNAIVMGNPNAAKKVIMLTDPG